MEKLREVKEPDELERIAAAAELATSVLEDVLGRGLAGRTEREVALDIESSIRAAGGEDPSFPGDRGRRAPTARCRTPSRATWRSPPACWW